MPELGFEELHMSLEDMIGTLNLGIIIAENDDNVVLIPLDVAKELVKVVKNTKTLVDAHM